MHPITYISRDDIAGLGFDTYTISDGEMEAIADDMANDYLQQLYWSSLKIIVEDRYSHIPKKGVRKVFLRENITLSGYAPCKVQAVQVALYDVSEIVSTDEGGMVWEEVGEDVRKLVTQASPN